MVSIELFQISPISIKSAQTLLDRPNFLSILAQLIKPAKNLEDEPRPFPDQPNFYEIGPILNKSAPLSFNLGSTYIKPAQNLKGRPRTFPDQLNLY
jgi:hypothetical protein